MPVHNVPYVRRQRSAHPDGRKRNDTDDRSVTVMLKAQRVAELAAETDLKPGVGQRLKSKACSILKYRTILEPESERTMHVRTKPRPES
ncbi:hypothetical protein EVAR_18395_1 [Eumeta japonica]|uniref:Uncharacterized protein n=1 Tax=Eumeta variegata TaxID=151549 RepID=A0A4C1UU02_EUMVA|nr:hypothetical protein EVAR_18395_1 [Eumeta japonica]